MEVEDFMKFNTKKQSLRGHKTVGRKINTSLKRENDTLFGQKVTLKYNIDITIFSRQMTIGFTLQGIP